MTKFSFLIYRLKKERRDIFRVQLQKVKRPEHAYDLDSLARESQYFVGAEIENAIIDAMYQAFYDKQRPMVTNDIVKSLKKMIPLAESQKEQVGKLRDWLREGRDHLSILQRQEICTQKRSAVGEIRNHER